MKRCFLVIAFCLLSLNIFATQNVSFDINISKDVTIGVGLLAGYGGNMEDSYINRKSGLYWDLLNLGKNIQNQLRGKTGHMYIFIDIFDNRIDINSVINEKIYLIERVVYKNENEIKRIIFNAIKLFYNIEIIDKPNNSIQVFHVNYRDSGLSIDKGVLCLHLFFTKEHAEAYIKDEEEFNKKYNTKRKYFIEVIALTRENIKNVGFES